MFRYPANQETSLCHIGEFAKFPDISAHNKLSPFQSRPMDIERCLFVGSSFHKGSFSFEKASQTVVLMIMTLRSAMLH